MLRRRPASYPLSPCHPLSLPISPRLLPPCLLSPRLPSPRLPSPSPPSPNPFPPFCQQPGSTLGDWPKPVDTLLLHSSLKPLPPTLSSSPLSVRATCPLHAHLRDPPLPLPSPPPPPSLPTSLPLSPHTSPHHAVRTVGAPRMPSGSSRRASKRLSQPRGPRRGRGLHSCSPAR